MQNCVVLSVAVVVKVAIAPEYRNFKAPLLCLHRLPLDMSIEYKDHFYLYSSTLSNPKGKDFNKNKTLNPQIIRVRMQFD